MSEKYSPKTFDDGDADYRQQLDMQYRHELLNGAEKGSQRYDEVKEYDAELDFIKNRTAKEADSDAFEGFENSLDAIDRVIDADPEASRLDQLAQKISKLRVDGGSENLIDTLKNQLYKKLETYEKGPEDLEALSREDANGGESVRQDVIYRILERMEGEYGTFAESVAESTREDETPVASEVPTEPEVIPASSSAPENDTPTEPIDPNVLMEAYYAEEERVRQEAAARKMAETEVEEEFEESSDEDDLEDEIVNEQERRFTAPSGFDNPTQKIKAGSITPEDIFGKTPAPKRHTTEQYDDTTMNPVNDPAREPRERRNLGATAYNAGSAAMNWVRNRKNREQSSLGPREHANLGATAYNAYESLKTLISKRSADRQDKISTMEDGTKKKLLIGGALATTAMVGIATWYFYGRNGFFPSGNGEASGAAANLLTTANGAPDGLDGLKDAAEEARKSVADAPEAIPHAANDPQAGLSAEKLSEVAGTNGTWNIPEGGGLIDAMESNGLDTSKLTTEAMGQLIDKYPDVFEWHTYGNGTVDLWVKNPGELSATIAADVRSL